MLHSPEALLRIQWRLRPGQTGGQTNSSNAAGGTVKEDKLEGAPKSMLHGQGNVEMNTTRGHVTNS